MEGRKICCSVGPVRSVWAGSLGGVALDLHVIIIIIIISKFFIIINIIIFQLHLLDREVFTFEL
jgi:hypothetical protein